MKKIRYIYAGFDPETPLILSGEPEFDLIASALNPVFLTKTRNPINLVFKNLYFLRQRELMRWLELSLYFSWRILNAFSSSVFRSNKNLLGYLSKNKIKILDFKNTQLVENFLIKHDIDLLIVNAWELIPEKIIKAPKYGTVNIHPSKLPKYRGALPTLWALKNEDRETAVSYILLDRSIDGGKILAQHDFPIESNDTAIDLEYKIKNVLKNTLAKDIKKYLKGEIAPHPQTTNGASVTGKYFDYLMINWSREKTKDIFNKILLYPFIEPGLYCFFFFERKKIEVRNARCLAHRKTFNNIVAGEFQRKGLSLLFQTIDGIIEVRLFKDLGIANSIYFLANIKNKKT